MCVIKCAINGKMTVQNNTTYYSDDHGVRYINDYIAERHNGGFECAHLTAKGRVLLSTKTYNPGDIMFVEGPLLIVAEKRDNDWFQRLQGLLKGNPEFSYDALWYWAALNTLCSSDVDEEGKSFLDTVSPEQQHRFLLLYHEKVEEPSADVIAIIEHFQLPCDPLLLETLLQIWILNCFEHTDDPLGYATYFMSSFMSHSCLPSAVWHYEGDNFVLRARSMVHPGSEVCCSYLSEDALLESTHSRRHGLEESKKFVCTCERCTEPFDTSRGFLCPACRRESIFPPNDVEEKQDKPGTCTCGYAVSDDEWTKLVKIETQLDKRLKEWEKLCNKGGRARMERRHVDELLIQSAENFEQHWLLGNLWSRASDFFTNSGETEAAIELVKKRVKLIEKTYEGLNGAHAWALEELGDLLRKNNDVQDAKDAYRTAVQTLRLMFGDIHEYTTDALTKLQELEDEPHEI